MKIVKFVCGVMLMVFLSGIATALEVPPWAQYCGWFGSGLLAGKILLSD